MGIVSQAVATPLPSVSLPFFRAQSRLQGATALLARGLCPVHLRDCLLVASEDLKIPILQFGKIDQH